MVFPEVAMHQSPCVSGDTEVNDFVGYARIRSSSPATDETAKGTVSILTWRAAIQRKQMAMTRNMVWNRPRSSGTPLSRSRKKTRLRGWKRRPGNLMDSSGSFVVASRTSAAKVDRNHQHSVSFRSLWKIGIDRSWVVIQFAR